MTWVNRNTVKATSRIPKTRLSITGVTKWFPGLECVATYVPPAGELPLPWDSPPRVVGPRCATKARRDPLNVPLGLLGFALRYLRIARARRDSLPLLPDCRHVRPQQQGPKREEVHMLPPRPPSTFATPQPNPARSTPRTSGSRERENTPTHGGIAGRYPCPRESSGDCITRQKPSRVGSCTASVG